MPIITIAIAKGRTLDQKRTLARENRKRMKDWWEDFLDWRALRAVLRIRNKLIIKAPYWGWNS
jgi:hypothetical protein